MTVLQVVDGPVLDVATICSVFFLENTEKETSHSKNTMLPLFVGVSFFFNSLLFPAVMLFVEQQRVLNVATVC